MNDTTANSEFPRYITSFFLFTDALNGVGEPPLSGLLKLNGYLGRGGCRQNASDDE